jgi:hypothetical protein
MSVGSRKLGGKQSHETLAHAEMPRPFGLRHFHIDSSLFSLDNVSSKKTQHNFRRPVAMFRAFSDSREIDAR